MKRWLNPDPTAGGSSKQPRGEDADEEEAVVQPEDTPRGGKRSPIWDFFRDEPRSPLTPEEKAKMTPKELKDWKDTRFSICEVVVNTESNRKCGARIKRSQGNTKGMTGHLSSLHKAEFAEFLRKKSVNVVDDATNTWEVYTSSKQLDAAQAQARVILEKPPLARKGPSTRTIDSYLTTDAKKIEKWKVNSHHQRRLDIEITLFLARCGLPFSLVEQPGFIQ